MPEFINNPQHQQLLHEVASYWTVRSEGYSQTNQEELETDKQQLWCELILAQLPQGKSLTILDIGTGPGFLAIILAKAGHKVTGVDVTPAMLAQAKNNAAAQEVTVQWVESDVHQLPFADQQFDLVVSRNVTWNLKEPSNAYCEWLRVLKSGGRLINFDANWYLHLFDETLRAGYVQDRANAKARDLDDHYVNTDIAEMERIAYQLPLSKERRPAWDAAILLNNEAVSRLYIDRNIGRCVWDETEKVNYGSTPMFMLSVEKA